MQYDHSGAWLLPDDDNPEMNGSKISIARIMVTIIWGVNGFYIIDLLPHGTSYNSDYFIDNILSPLNSIKGQIWSETTIRYLWLHLDNSRVHNSMKSNAKYGEYGLKRTPHPPYSPNLAPSDFYLFCFLKDKLKGQKFTSPYQLKETIIENLSSISRDEKNVFLKIG